MMAKKDTHTIMAIDPGTHKSGIVCYQPALNKVEGGVADNHDVLDMIKQIGGPHIIAIEMMSCYGMAIGKDTMESLVWVGRFMQEACGKWRPEYQHEHVVLITRHKIRLHLCNSARAKDTNIRQVLIDRFGPGKEKAIGLKKSPGPLYGIKTHAWAALALAVTYYESQDMEIIQ